MQPASIRKLHEPATHHCGTRRVDGSERQLAAPQDSEHLRRPATHSTCFHRVRGAYHVYTGSSTALVISSIIIIIIIIVSLPLPHLSPVLAAAYLRHLLLAGTRCFSSFRL